MVRIAWRGGYLISLVLLLAISLAAGAAAQNGGPAVTVTTVAGNTFPEVSLMVRVWGAEGPVTTLTGADFQILEAEAAGVASLETVQPSQIYGMSWVLALDLSVPDNDLAALKAAANDLISQIDTRGDRLAILTFDNDVGLAYDFTNNTAELQAAVASLTPQGDRTALHKAIVEAVDRLAEYGEHNEGHPGIIVITDSRDNSGLVAAETALNRVRQARVPLSVLGFGEKVQAAESFKDQVDGPWGQYTTLNGAAQVLLALQETVTALRQGYELTFVSGVLADNANHEVTVTVTAPQGDGQGRSQFLAPARPVMVTLPDLAAEQTVSGVVELHPDIRVSTPTYRVAYLLDGQLLQERDEPPYSLAWDSSLAGPGLHHLTVRVTDAAGNQGQIDVPLTVIVPPAVTLSSAQTELQMGQAARLQLKIETSEEIARVEVLVDGRVAASNERPPFDEFVLDPSIYGEPGQYEIRVRVTDGAGQVAEDSLDLTVSPPPPPQPGLIQRIVTNRRFINTVTLTASLAAILAFLAIGFIVLRWITAAQRRWSERRCRLELANLGNIQSRYSLRAQSPTDDLSFYFFLNGRELPRQMAPYPAGVAATGSNGAAVVAGPTVVAGYQGPGPASRPLAPPPSGPAPAGGPSRIRQGYETARATEAQAQGCLYTLIDLLEVIGSTLPGSLGKPLLRLSASLYSGQRTVEQAKMAPYQAMSTAKYVKGEVAGNVPGQSRAGGPFSAGGSGRPVASAAGDDRQPVFVEEEAMAAGPARPSRPRSKTAPLGVPTGWSETPAIEPGDKLLIEVLIKPEKPFKKNDYAFTVTSKAMGEDKTTSFVEEGIIRIRGLFWLWRFLSQALVIGITLALIAAVIALALWRVTGLNLLAYWPI